MNLCASGESKERDGGSYNCADGSWFVKNSKCCECCPVPLQRAESTRAPSMPTLSCELVRMAGLCAQVHEPSSQKENAATVSRVWP